MEKLKNKILDLLTEYEKLEAIVSGKNKEIETKRENLQELIKNSELDEIEKVLTYIYADTILYNTDLQMAFIRLIYNIETYKEISEENLPENIQVFYNKMKNWAPKRTFMVEKEDLVETEIGILEKKRLEFLNSDYYKSFKENIKG